MSSKIGWLHIGILKEVNSQTIFLAFILNLGFIECLKNQEVRLTLD